MKEILKKHKYISLLVMGIVVTAIVGMIVANFGPNRIRSKEVKLSGYKGIEVITKKEHKVTNEDVEQAFEERLEEAGAYKKITSGRVKLGDVICISFQGKMNGVKDPLLSKSKYDLEVGSHTLINGFENGLVGKQIGSKETLNLTFPKAYSNKAYAGKNVTFVVDIHYGKVRYTRMNVTDKIVKKFTDKNTVQDLYDQVERDLKYETRKAFEEQKREDLWKTIILSAQIADYNDEQWQSELDRYDESYEKAAKELHVPVETFITEYCGYTMNEYRSVREETCNLNLNRRIVVKAIAKKEGIRGDSDKTLEKKVEDFLMEKAKFTYE